MSRDPTMARWQIRRVLPDLCLACLSVLTVISAPERLMASTGITESTATGPDETGIHVWVMSGEHYNMTNYLLLHHPRRCCCVIGSYEMMYA